MTAVRHDYSVILRATNSLPEILTITTSDSVTLPSAENPAHFWQSIEPVTQAMLDTYGLHVTTIRCLEPMIKQDENLPLINVYLQLYHGGDISDKMRWIAIDALPDLQLPSVVNHVSNWINWLLSDHSQRQTWYRLDGIQTIIDSVQERFGVQPLQVRSWERSTVWRIPMQEGNRYLKIVPPMFAFEPTLTTWLSQRFPENSTPTLDWFAPNQMLMADYGGQPLTPDLGLPAFENALSIYAKMQVDLCQQVELLKTMDVPYRPVQWIAEHLENFLKDDANLIRGKFPIMQEQVRTIRDALPRLQAACDVLSHSPIPDSLEHGDLWFGQIMMREGQPIFTDWSDSTITCPLFSLPFFVAEKDDMPDVVDAVRRISDAYLNVWGDFASREIIDSLMPHVNLLSPLYTAMRYQYDILPQMEIQWEMENMVSYNLRLLLKALGQ